MSRIDIKNMSKKIKTTTILDNINMSFTSGKIYGLRGKNGCGKTMLMRCICGLVIPTEGSIFIDNQELHNDIMIPGSIGALIENPSFLPQYSGYKNLKLLASLSGYVEENAIVNAMIRVGLDPYDKRAYKKYSLGMKQKLGIANAIMGEPDIIILDEPINALDEDSVNMVKNELIRLSQKNKLIIIACHDKEELEFLCDIIYDMKSGCIVGQEELSV